MKPEGKPTIARLNPCALGTAFGILWGVYLFLLALLPNAGVIYFNQGTVAMIQTLIPWFTVGLLGAIAGLITGLVCGFICGFLLGWIYNKVAGAHACRVCKAC